MRKDDLWEIFIEIMDSTDNETKAKFDVIIEDFLNKNVIYLLTDPETNTDIIFADYPNFYRETRDLLTHHEQLVEIAGLSGRLNHAINCASHILDCRPGEISGKASRMDNGDPRKKFTTEIAAFIIQNFDNMDWTELQFMSVPGNEHKIVNYDFDLPARLYYFTNAFHYWIISEKGHQSFLLKRVYAVSTKVYTDNYMQSGRYSSILEKTYPLLDHIKISDKLEGDFNQLKKVFQYYHFYRCWKNITGAEKILALAEKNKNKVLENLSNDIYSAEENPHDLKNRLSYVLSFFKWKDELENERRYLTEQIHASVRRQICLECGHMGLVYMEGAIYCTVCGFSMEG